MPIKLVTGTPGAGKSLRLVQFIKDAVGKRDVFVHGIDGLQPFGWEECDPHKWQDLPDGSLVVVDEAWKVWPSRRAGTVPPDVAALAEHRHRGFDFILATQHPTGLDSFLRNLVGEHEHLFRQFGSSVTRVFKWGECHTDVQSVGARGRSDGTIWKMPSALFPLYQSASLHTVKRKLPWKLLAIPVLLVGAIGMAVLAYASVKGLGAAKPTAAPSAEPTPQRGGGRDSSAPLTFSSPADYAAAFTPRIPAHPWSAPVFDGRRPVSEPDLLCVASEAKGCQCYTEQITRVKVPLLQCLRVAREGVYNPFRRPLASRNQASGKSDSESSPKGSPKS